MIKPSSVYSSEILGYLRKSSVILGKCSETLSGLRVPFEESSESVWKFLENHQKLRHKYGYIITRILYAGLWIRILSSCVQLNCEHTSSITT